LRKDEVGAATVGLHDGPLSEAAIPDVDGASFQDLISGRKTGPLAGLQRLGLALLSLGYAAAVRCRNRLFDLGLRRAYRPPAPVISVGNLTTGGTGKTPCVAWLANRIAAEGRNVVLLSRGYKALGETGRLNDEKLLLDQLCPGIPHLQNPDRRASARVACREHAADVLILDDGFQHRLLVRSLDIVLIDALEPFGYGHMLPRGLLREPVSSLKRADVVILTRADQISEPQRVALLVRLSRVRPNRPFVTVSFPPEGWLNAEGETSTINALAGKRVAAFCGIGNPAGFERTLSNLDLDVAAMWHFEDHHHYTQADFEALAAWSDECRAEALVTTHKDLVKIPHVRLGECPVWALRIGMDILDGAEMIEGRLEELLRDDSHRKAASP